ncbi:hypothetical protein PC118_g23248 [Phytophthora cactorum]|uniref:Uncharacterized protein n=1 Tax=Phytophthora cactorum TaxID=29920 RepID=A0A8T1AGP3_9STRA|nr:hypothetical protein PC111_g23067 [Phytophthora cactorum]KAG2793746.1 hypothetical protein PC112_g23313 [Phytophthora cactorum]KAG2815552.1 hypothetical protein PC113_g23191 [Phytophthora cactorum]KAG2873135.1 hypothetical protein PC114_g26008 [Phytophthora cactorum]KAG2878259.1 hypothetical protein PC115_g23121 [Phytophthora cactorum]
MKKITSYYQLRLPDKTHASNGKSIYKSGAFDRAVSYFCCDTKIEFDTLYPYTCLTTTANTSLCADLHGTLTISSRGCQ